jgi:hypothetical protein
MIRAHCELPARLMGSGLMSVDFFVKKAVKSFFIYFSDKMSVNSAKGLFLTGLEVPYYQGSGLSEIC